uniref:Cyclin B n=1 Tax=Artemia sinica TaxID=112780 RepID=S5N912_9CRUS|nr:cyclin B [Artemia sinica]
MEFVTNESSSMSIDEPEESVSMDVVTKELSSMSVEEQQAYSSSQMRRRQSYEDASDAQPYSEYVNDIYPYMLKLEAAHPIKRRYLDDSKTLNPAMRATLIDWLIEVHKHFQLLQETLDRVMRTQVMLSYIQST